LSVKLLLSSQGSSKSNTSVSDLESALSLHGHCHHRMKVQCKILYLGTLEGSKSFSFYHNEFLPINEDEAL